MEAKTEASNEEVEFIQENMWTSEEEMTDSQKQMKSKTGAFVS